MLHYFLHSNQHAHTHPNKLYLIHISLVLLLSSRLHPCPSQNWETLLGFGHTAWLITLCTFWINRGTFSQTSPSSLAASRKILQSQCLGRSQPQYKSNSSVAEGQKTHMRMGRRLVEGRGAGNRKKNTGRIKGGQKESGVSKYEVPIRKKKVRTTSFKI